MVWSIPLDLSGKSGSTCIAPKTFEARKPHHNDNIWPTKCPTIFIVPMKIRHSFALSKLCNNTKALYGFYQYAAVPDAKSHSCRPPLPFVSSQSSNLRPIIVANNHLNKLNKEFANNSTTGTSQLRHANFT